MVADWLAKDSIKLDDHAGIYMIIVDLFQYNFVLIKLNSKCMDLSSYHKTFHFEMF